MGYSPVTVSGVLRGGTIEPKRVPELVHGHRHQVDAERR